MRLSLVSGDRNSEQLQVERALRAYFDAFTAQDRDSIRRLTTMDFVFATVFATDRKLFVTRADRPQWLGVSSMELIPTGGDTFALEFTGSSIRFTRT